MTFTVRSLLDMPSAHTVSLTPGVGEDRAITWAHVCELPEPWLWIGDGALIMTTGLPVPKDPQDQVRYIEGMSRAGIAGITIGEDMSAPPLSDEMIRRATELDFAVLETAHLTPFITLAKGIAEQINAERQAGLLASVTRERWLRGSILLANVLDQALTEQTAIQLISSYDIEPPFALALRRIGDDLGVLEHAGAFLEQAEIRAVLTAKDGYLTLLAQAGDELVQALEGLAEFEGPIALSLPFRAIGHTVEAQRQARLMLAGVSPQQRRLLRAEHRSDRSPFFPSDSATRLDAANEVLGALLAYDHEHGTELVRTLHLFLSENRSWVRTAERLFIHRQTLVARIARIEHLTHRQLNQTGDVSVLWFAVQCAAEEGLFEMTD